MSLRGTKRYQYATEGVRGDGTSRRKWFARLGWYFGIDITITRPSGGGGSIFIEPITIESLDTVISIKVRYKGKLWDKIYYITPSKPISVVVSFIKSVMESLNIPRARLTKKTIDNDDITITVRKK